jgi:hypothetical protein
MNSFHFGKMTVSDGRSDSESVTKEKCVTLAFAPKKRTYSTLTIATATATVNTATRIFWMRITAVADRRRSGVSNIWSGMNRTAANAPSVKNPARMVARATDGSSRREPSRMWNQSRGMEEKNQKTRTGARRER